MPDYHRIKTLEALNALYRPVNPISLAKETPHLTPQYQKWIEAAPFFTLASQQKVPSAGQMTKGAMPDFDVDTYDGELQDRQEVTLY